MNWCQSIIDGTMANKYPSNLNQNDNISRHKVQFEIFRQNDVHDVFASTRHVSRAVYVTYLLSAHITRFNYLKQCVRTRCFMFNFLKKYSQLDYNYSHMLMNADSISPNRVVSSFVLSTAYT